MTETELITEVFNKLPEYFQARKGAKKFTKRIVQQAMDTIEETLLAGEGIAFKGFGRFEVLTTRKYIPNGFFNKTEGVDPKGGTTKRWPRVTFYPSPDFKKALRSLHKPAKEPVEEPVKEE